jgi:nucleotide-binding universal stress UspA family protein
MSESNQEQAGKIVVGVDGSDSAESALRWAVRQAKLTGDIVEAVIAWQYPIVGGAYGWPAIAMIDGTDFAAMAEKTLEEAIGSTTEPGSPVTIERKVVEGYPPSVLVDESADADLLVVGCRGHGTFTEALLGSVSQHCSHHARCPVVIVRGPGRLDWARLS